MSAETSAPASRAQVVNDLADRLIDCAEGIGADPKDFIAALTIVRAAVIGTRFSAADRAVALEICGQLQDRIFASHDADERQPA